jgi:predicted DNA-binding WGR domain protein
MIEYHQKPENEMQPKNITGAVVRKITLRNTRNGANKEYCVYITIDELSRLNVFRAWGKIGAVTHSKHEGFQDRSGYATITTYDLVNAKKKRGYYVVYDDLYCVPGNPSAQTYVKKAMRRPLVGIYPVLHGKIEEISLAKANKRSRKSFRDWLQTKPTMNIPKIIAAI